MTTQEASVIFSSNGFHVSNQYDPATGFTHDDLFMIRNRETGEPVLMDVTRKKLIELAEEADTAHGSQPARP